MASAIKSLKIESLESRVLLSGVDLPSVNSAAETIKDSAVTSTGGSIDIKVAYSSEGGLVLNVFGDQHADVTVDLGQLPDNISMIRLFSLDSVKFVGEHGVDQLYLQDIKLVDAGRLTVSDRGGMVSIGVDHIKIDEAPKDILIEGPGGAFAGGKTLLEVGHFSSAAGATIEVRVETLGLATTSHVVALTPLSRPFDGTVLLNFQPDEAPTSNSTGGEISVVTGGDFAKYFFATQEERRDFELSALFTRQRIRVDLAPVTSLLNDPMFQAALDEALGSRRAQTDLHFLAQNGASHLRMLIPANDHPAEASRGQGDEAHRTDSVQLHFAFGRAATADSAGHSAGAESDVLAVAALKLATLELAAINDAGRLGEAVSESLHSAVDSLREPISQLVSGLRDQLATFGAIASARVTEQLKADHQAPLLLGARAGRPPTDNDREVLVLSV